MRVRPEFALLVVDKPAGPTSHDVVKLVRRGTEVEKVGHTGTLDPGATGVLVLCLGKATRLSEFLTGSDKIYQATVRFGQSTTTYDIQGEVVENSGRAPELAEIEEAAKEFRGEIEQVPPAFSAVRVGGKRAYDLARGGQMPELEARTVVIHRLELLAYQAPDLQIEVECSAGTYLRSLAHDLGQTLGTGAHLTQLRRTAAGAFSLEEAISFAELEAALADGSWRQMLTPPAAGLVHLRAVALTEEGLTRVRHGRMLTADGGDADGLARALARDGQLVAILEAAEEGRAWHPKKVLLN